MKYFFAAFVLFSSLHAGAAVLCADFNKAVASGSDSQKLKKYLDVQWKYLMTTYPEWATYVGYPGQNDRWTDRSLEAIVREKEMTKCQLKAAERISKKSLSESDKLNLDLTVRKLKLYVEGQRFPSEYLALDHMGGLHTELPDILISMPKSTEKDYLDMIARLEKSPELAAQVETLLREGAKKKITQVKQFLGKVPGQLDVVLTKNIEDSPLYAPFKEINQSIPEDKRAALQTKARDVITNKVYPTLQKFKTFLVNDYIPNARESIAFSDMPDGKAWYNHAIKGHTTTSMTFDELHDLGLKEVARIKDEMTKTKDNAKYKGDLAKFNKFLLEDSQFFYKKPEELLAGYRDIAKRLDAELPKVFKTLPRLTYGVREMPAYKAPSSPAAYYMGGSLESGRPGYFEANTHDLKSRPKWGMESLTIHEAVPGHHLQIAIAQELEGLPEIRKHDGYTAFVEGWALYAEGLGEELGVYKDPYSKYGQLTNEMWRAVRLVVDTGMHAKGWTRDQAIKYFMDQMPTTKHEAEVEIDRYITWPGQALAYKVGQLRIKNLREIAKRELGDNFNVRLFHDEVLKNGALPMDILEKQIVEWVEKQKAQVKKKG